VLGPALERPQQHLSRVAIAGDSGRPQHGHRRRDHGQGAGWSRLHASAPDQPVLDAAFDTVSYQQFVTGFDVRRDRVQCASGCSAPSTCSCVS